jgi:signal transduction histidine kinase
VEDLSSTKQLEAQLRHQDRLATIGRFAAGVAHEVGNPLAAVMMVSTGMERDGEVTPERLSGLVDAARRIDAIVRSLVSFARSGSARSDGPVQAVSVDAVAHQAVNLVRLSRHREIELQVGATDAIVEGHTQELVQVVVNLLSNALDATPEGRRVAVVTRADERAVVLEVIDEGTGMPADVAAHVFERRHRPGSLGRVDDRARPPRNAERREPARPRNHDDCPPAARRTWRLRDDYRLRSKVCTTRRPALTLL